jgi:hypothetical protein
MSTTRAASHLPAGRARCRTHSLPVAWYTIGLRRSELALWAVGSLCLVLQPVGCGSKFSAGATGGTGGSYSGGSGGSGGGGGSSGTSGDSGNGGDGTGGAAGTGGTAGTGGSADEDAGETDASVPDAGTCSKLTALTFQNGGFETGAFLPGWEGAPNPSYYAEVGVGAARSGSFGIEFNDTGAGLPGIQQRVPVGPLLVGRQVAVDAWVRLVSFPSVRLLVWATYTPRISRWRGASWRSCPAASFKVDRRAARDLFEPELRQPTTEARNIHSSSEVGP